MSDLLGIGASGVRAYQTALSVTASNISNASTTGYVRRDTSLSESPVAYAGGVTSINKSGGGGVDVAGITRDWDNFQAAEVRSASADVASSDTSVTYLTRVQSALTDSSVSSSLTTFFTDAQALAADPTSTAARTQLLSDAGSSAQAFQNTANNLSAVSSDILTDATTSVATLNGLSSSLAKLNDKLNATTLGTTNQAALLDQRDQLLDQMSSLAAISVSLSTSGAATVKLNGATGPALVNGSNAATLSVSGNSSGAFAFAVGTGTTMQAVGMSGGALAGLADVGSRAANAAASLDEVATGFAAAVNGVQKQGVDLSGSAGTAMFSTNYTNVTALPGTSGGASIQASIAANAKPHAGGYTATFDATSGKWTFARADGSKTVSGTGTLSLDGVSVDLGGAPAAGDGYQIDTGSGAAGLALTGISSSQIAAASPWSVDSPIDNGGTASLRATTSGTPSASSYTLAYQNGTVTVTNSATGAVLGTAAYLAGKAMDAGGVAFTFSGMPADGDSFTVTPTGAGSRDNSNLAVLQSVRATGGFETRIDDLTTDTATTLASRQALATAQGAIRDNAVTTRNGTSGVNLDQEAVDLLKFQQAYGAASRVVSVARETFQQLLDIN